MGTWRNLGKVNRKVVRKHWMAGPQPPIALPGWRAKKRRSAPPVRTVKSNAVSFTFTLPFKLKQLFRIVLLLMTCGALSHPSSSLKDFQMFEHPDRCFYLNSGISHFIVRLWYFKAFHANVSQCDWHMTPCGIFHHHLNNFRRLNILKYSFIWTAGLKSQYIFSLEL